MLITPLTLNDSKEAARLHQKSFFKGWEVVDFEQILQDELIHGLKLEEKKVLCGYILWREVENESEILTLVVGSNWQRRGFGSFLLKTLFQKLIQKKVVQLFIEVAEDNQGAICFYIKHGFHFVGKRPHYYPREDNKFAAAMNLVKQL